MRQSGFFLSILAIAIFGAALTGCDDAAKKKETTKSTSSDNEHGDHDHEDGDHEDGDHEDGDHKHAEGSHGKHDHDHGDNDSAKTDMEKMKEGLANLSETDRASAMKQHTCPVTGDMLGTMGEPIKVTVKDQEVWICCKGCKEDIMENPDEYLAKLKK